MFLQRRYLVREKSPDRIFQVLPEKGALKKVPFRLVRVVVKTPLNYTPRIASL